MLGLEILQLEDLTPSLQLTFLEFSFPPAVLPPPAPPELRPGGVRLGGDLLTDITVNVITQTERLYALLAGLCVPQPLPEGVQGGGGGVARGGHDLLVVVPGEEVDPGRPLLSQYLHREEDHLHNN